MCEACPFNFYTEASAQAQNWGCLPSPLDNLNCFNKFKKSISCHENDMKHCVGFAADKPEILDFPVIGYSDWYCNDLK